MTGPRATTDPTRALLDGWALGRSFLIVGGEYDGPVYEGDEADEPELVDEEWDEGEGR
jgi:hypothetical protein